MPPKGTPPRVVFWFRTDLRVHDNPALKAALDLKPEVLYPIWCWDSKYVYGARVGVNRWQFLLDCQEDVSKSITKLNSKSKLFVLREPAVTLLPKLYKAWNITHLVFEKDTDAYARDRDRQVIRDAEAAGVTVIVKSGRTLWDSDDLVAKFGDKPPMSMSQLQQAGQKVGPIARPVDTPSSLPDPGEMPLDFEQTQPQANHDFNKDYRTGDDAQYRSGLAGPSGDFSPPTLKELGFPEATGPHRGGESVILRSLERILKDDDYTGTFEKPKTSPAAFEPQSTCLTSPYLHFGALSCRYFYHRVEEIVEKRKKARKAVSEPPTSLTGQLLFRDMYFACQAALGAEFGQTYGNPRCRFIPWHLPTKITKDGKHTGTYEIDDEEKEQWLQRWSHGQTGFPWIDAIMRQLRQEGWIHHLARHSVACFLTRGGAYISWERGAEVFEELLIDHEAACNIGNWQWLSCTAFFHQFSRCYSPIAFGKKWDEQGTYIRKYVPELKDIPKKYIFEPHKTPIADQKKAGVLIKGDGSEKERDGLAVYPKPMFDFSERREICMQAMSAAYKVGLYGNDPKVLDGTWKSLFDDNGEGPTEGKKGGPGGMSYYPDADGSEEVYSEIGVPVNQRKHTSDEGKGAHKRARSGGQQSTLDKVVKKSKS